jgi:4-amino-4-deoxy-L-arabinose transferase-like glycosyltransferase
MLRLLGSRRSAAAYAVFLAVLAWFLYFHDASAAGLIGPDEPRYAQISREMLRSGDYITPYLLHEPWFEKPPLNYWLTAVAFRIFGVNEAAARLPSAIFAVGFLILFAWQTRRLFPGEAVRYSVPILLSSLGWIAYGRAATTDMLFSSTLGGALGFMGLWLWQGRRRWLFGFHGMLALSVLAKGFGGVVLAALILAAYCAAIRDFQWLWRVLNPWGVTFFSVIALPWMAAMYFKHGQVFFQEFIVKQHFKRFLTSELAHPGPWWYYLPILLAGLFPWTAHTLLIGKARDVLADSRRIFLMSWILAVLAFFSISQGKLPGYILVVLPAAAMWLGEEWKRATLGQLRAVGLAQALLLLTLISMLGSVPAALSYGISHAPLRFQWLWTWKSGAFATAVLMLVWLAWRGRRVAAVLAAATITTGALAWLLGTIAPEIDRTASARPVAQAVCGKNFGINDVRRQMRYGLEFYCDRAMVESSSMEYTLAPEAPPGSRAVQIFPDSGLTLWRRF